MAERWIAEIVNQHIRSVTIWASFVQCILIRPGLCVLILRAGCIKIPESYVSWDKDVNKPFKAQNDEYLLEPGFSESESIAYYPDL